MGILFELSSQWWWWGGHNKAHNNNIFHIPYPLLTTITLILTLTLSPTLDPSSHSLPTNLTFYFSFFVCLKIVSSLKYIWYFPNALPNFLHYVWQNTSESNSVVISYKKHMETENPEPITHRHEVLPFSRARNRTAKFLFYGCSENYWVYNTQKIIPDYKVILKFMNTN